MAASTIIKSNRVTYCRPEAYELFVEQLPVLHTCEGLLRAAVAISMHALDDVDPHASSSGCELSPAGSRAVAQPPGGGDPGQHACGVVRGRRVLAETSTYYNALNSYLPAVLNSRRGLPVMLSLIYKVVGEWAGLTFKAMNARATFMVRVRCDDAWMIVDPFFGGQMLTREEAFDRIDRVAGRPMPRQDEMLATPTHEQWLAPDPGQLAAAFCHRRTPRRSGRDDRTGQRSTPPQRRSRLIGHSRHATQHPAGRSSRGVFVVV